MEQIFRGTPAEQRWAIKFLCLGVGGAFAFDFYMYAEALLFHTIDANVWGARGYINALVVPMLAISAARNPHWKVDIVVSRQLIFQSVTLVGAGLYLLAMALAGYYIRVVGGEFGTVGQTVFLFSALVLLLALMFSGELRARTKVFFNKHFFRSKYDYREEWLRINEVLSGAPLDASLCERALHALTRVVESTGGALYQRQRRDYVATASWNMPVQIGDCLAHDEPLLRFMTEKHWVINLEEYARTPKHYDDLVLPKSFTGNARIWAVVPLVHHAALFGFAVLAQPRAPLALNWEIRDMLLMTGRHIAGHLALRESNEALIEARQFEAFNRLSAYVVHDLKNLVAQLSLLVSNAARHRDNPEFMSDAIQTVANATEKMNKLLGQLRKGRMEAGDAKRVSVHALVKEAVQHRALQLPVPSVRLDGADAVVLANPERLAAVLEHLIQNAQDATPPEGIVRVQVSTETAAVSIAITDNGCGMDAVFLREQLFKPFHTTKGNAGMGIGVYESREFVQAIGGRFSVVSAPGQGTTFTLNLPVYGVNENETTAHSARVG
ncbi:MAG: PEP-CTERM system histidine kinase PrsK [Gammaproteobacteria bacterium]|nr:PEP-CTERM system histidine kinase PrsK [Gammaproteobacteria bacterium]